MTGRRLTTSTGLLAASALLLTGCATAGTGDDGDDESLEVSDQITEDDVTLRLAYIDDPPTEALVEGFMEEHPNITIETEQTDFTNYVSSITRSMSSDEAPDLAQYNPGAMRSLVPAGHIMDLTDYGELYDWEEAFPPASLEQLMSDDEAQEFGTGGLYAAPGSLSVLGVYYNAEVLAEAGIESPPEDLDEFEGALEAVAETGATPLSLGTLEVGGFQLWNAVLNSLGERDEYLDWVYGAPGASIQTDAAEEAAQTIEEWVEAEYVSSGANATSDSDALADFTSGESAFHVTGNWNASVVEEELGEDAGFFVLPGEDPEAAPVASGSSVAYSISADTEHPHEAAAFLNWLSSPEAAEVQVEAGFMPVDTEADVAQDELLGDVAEAFTPVAEGDNIVPFPDFAAPGMVDDLTSGVQGIMSGEQDAEGFLDSLQDSWSDHHE